jgi:ethanolamine-phosphate cytidylyltransferase
MQERIFNLLALKYVDDVVIAAPWIVTEDLIKSLKINLVVHGTESKYDENYNIEAGKDDPFSVPKKLGIYKAIESKYDLNSEILVQRLIKNRDQYVKKFQTKNAKENDYYKNKEYINEI